jgi:hypothetical protein
LPVHILKAGVDGVKLVLGRDEGTNDVRVKVVASALQDDDDGLVVAQRFLVSAMAAQGIVNVAQGP